MQHRAIAEELDHPASVAGSGGAHDVRELAATLRGLLVAELLRQAREPAEVDEHDRLGRVIGPSPDPDLVEEQLQLLGGVLELLSLQQPSMDQERRANPSSTSC
jgi:hypothetical protein